jgi:hypothetical protein
MTALLGRAQSVKKPEVKEKSAINFMRIDFPEPGFPEHMMEHN